MPKMSFNTTQADDINTEKFGTRKDTVLKSAFSTSPLLDPGKYGESTVVDYAEKLNLDPAKLKNWFFKNVVNGSVPKSAGYFGSKEDFSMDYKDAPDVSSVTSGNGAGEPATPYIPNLTSPGEGVVDAKSQPKLDDAVTALLKAKNPSTFGSGDVANTAGRNPSTTAAKIKAAIPTFDANGVPQDLGKSGATI